MDRNRINNILDDDRALESLLVKTMHRAGRERDRSLVNAMADMDETQFRDELAKSRIQVGLHRPWWKRFAASPYVRAAAACIVCLLIMVGVLQLNMGNSDHGGYASMFNSYYTNIENINWSEYEAKDNKLINNAGGKTTAAILAEASSLLTKRSRHSAHVAVGKLEDLLYNLNYNRRLEPDLRWYLGLAYLKDEQIDKAREQFEWVIVNAPAHSADARNILDKLNTRMGS